MKEIYPKRGIIRKIKYITHNTIEAITLAKKYMSKYGGFTKYDYHTSCGNYIRNGQYFRWNNSTLSDPNGYLSMTAAQILADLYNS